ncbi:MAG: cupin domain-containing protein [Alphaproteobacteria bacterium]|nr:cupin domain-containing protein [Alphaproteobacteria bacterium]
MTRKISSLKKSLDQSPVRHVDSDLQIADLFTDPAAKFDVVVATLKGSHGKRISAVSDKAYFILKGSGTVTVDDETVDVGPMDLVHIPPGAVHGIKGEIKFLVIMSPPFDPQNDRTADEMD